MLRFLKCSQIWYKMEKPRKMFRNAIKISAKLHDALRIPLSSIPAPVRTTTATASLPGPSQFLLSNVQK